MQVALCEIIKAKIEILQSHCESPEETLKAIQQIGIHVDTQIKSFSNFSKEIDADAIIIATHGRRGLEHFINGSLAEDVVNHAVTPVLSFKLKGLDKNENILFPE